MIRNIFREDEEDEEDDAGDEDIIIAEEEEMSEEERQEWIKKDQDMYDWAQKVLHGDKQEQGGGTGGG